MYDRPIGTLSQHVVVTQSQAITSKYLKPEKNYLHH